MDLREEADRFYMAMLRYDMEFGRRYGELSYQSLLYMELIRGTDGCTVGRLAEALGVDKSTASRKVDALVRQGHVVKSRGTEDGRTVVLSLSPEMERVHSDEDRVYEAALARIQSELTAEEVEAVGKAFRILAEALSGEGHGD